MPPLNAPPSDLRRRLVAVRRSIKDAVRSLDAMSGLSSGRAHYEMQERRNAGARRMAKAIEMRGISPPHSVGYGT